MRIVGFDVGGVVCGVAALFALSAPVAAAVLDHQAQLARWSWWDNRDWEWYRDNIPFFESPDPLIDETYYYRWEVVTKHLVYASVEQGYILSEFVDRPGYGTPHGAGRGALGHQLMEVRWLRDRRPAQDFARYWSAAELRPRASANWYAHAVWSTYLVHRDRGFLARMAPALVAHVEGWLVERWDPAMGLFRSTSNDDGMMATITSRQSEDPFWGGLGFRPTLNSYLYGDLSALTQIMTELGDHAAAERFRSAAEALRARVLAELWDPRRGFFFPQSAESESSRLPTAEPAVIHTIPAGTLTHGAGGFAGSPYGRELIGFLPWYFHLPPPERGYEEAWRGVTDPQVFSGAHGLTSVERRDPLFTLTEEHLGWCGRSWPMLTAQVLTAMANVLHDYPQAAITPEDFNTVLTAYSNGQRRYGRPYVAEALHPDTGSWDGYDTSNHSEHHFNSTYADLVISGLVGLRPRSDDRLEIAPLAPASWSYWCLDEVAYHGHRVSVLWDRDGSRYGRGAGLVVLVDGVERARRADPGRLTVDLAGMDGRRDEPVPPPRHNLAVNNHGGYHPRLTASFTSATTSVARLQDGMAWYHASPANRWTTEGSVSANDWIALDLGVAQEISSVELFLLDDGEGAAVRAPLAYDLLAWDGTAWEPIPGQRRTPSVPTGGRPNRIEFPSLWLRHLRVQMTHRPEACSGLSEVMVWTTVERPAVPPAVFSENLVLADPQRGLPRVIASFTAPSARLADINDGRTIANSGSRNRWSAWRSPNRRDWIVFDLGEDRQVGRIEFHWWNDDAGIAAPRTVGVERWNGHSWVPFALAEHTPRRPVIGQTTTIRFPPMICRQIRVVVEHALPMVTAINEVAVWDE